MPADSRQQRRKLGRDRIKSGERSFAKGLGTAPTRADVLGVAEVLRAKLAEAGNAQRASEAAGLAHALSETSLRAFPATASIACTKGCSYCCYGFVGVLPPEAFRVAAAVRAGGGGSSAIEAVRARARPLIGLSPAERIGRKLACPMLVDGACSVYAVRPLVCRQTTSLSLPGCIEEFDGHDRNGRIEISSTHLAHASNAHVALLGALLAVGLPVEAYEFGSILEIVLGDPDCERRWLAGEDVFRDLGPSVKRPRNVDQVAAALAGELNA